MAEHAALPADELEALADHLYEIRRKRPNFAGFQQPEVEAAVEETLLCFAEGKAICPRGTPIRAYAIGVLWHRLYDRKRKRESAPVRARAIEFEAIEASPVEPAREPDDPLPDPVRLAEVLAKYGGCLTSRQLSALRCLAKGASVEEAARKMRMSVKNLKAMVQRGAARLRARIESERRKGNEPEEPDA